MAFLSSYRKTMGNALHLKVDSNPFEVVRKNA
jgi:hypothetical protein